MRSFHNILTAIFIISSLWQVTVLAQTSEKDQIKALQQELRLQKNDSLRASICIELTQSYKNDDFVRAAEYAERAVDYSMRTNHVNLKSACLKLAGELYLIAGQNDVAVDYFHQNVQLARREGNDVMVLKADFNLGAVWLLAGEYDEAEALMKKIEQKITLLDTASMIGVYTNMIMLYNKKQNFEACRKYFDRGMSLLRNNSEYKHLRGQLYSNYGDVLESQQRYEEAIAVFDTANTIFSELEDFARKGSCLYDMAVTYSLQGDRISAIDYYRQAFDLATLTNDDYLMRISSQQLYEEFNAESNIDSAFKYLVIASEVSPKIVELETKVKLNSQELRWRYETLQERENKSFQMKLLTGFALGALLIGLLVWRMHHRQLQMKLLRSEKNALELDAYNLQLKNNLLAAEVAQKDKQLTTEVLYRIQNNELVKDMVQKLLNINMLSGRDTKQAIQIVVKGLEKTLEETAWEDFEIRFQQVHPDFYSKLQEAYPDLTLNDRRLAAFLKLNMTTKEISAITGQNLSAIQMARWRLRKKLGLQETESALTDFFSSF